jgi:CheY-like chemotaxis protein
VPRRASALVVTDPQLPDVDSLTVLRAAKRQNPLLPLVIVTAYASIEPRSPPCGSARTMT